MTDLTRALRLPGSETRAELDWLARRLFRCAIEVGTGSARTTRALGDHCATGSVYSVGLWCDAPETRDDRDFRTFLDGIADLVIDHVVVPIRVDPLLWNYSVLHEAELLVMRSADSQRMVSEVLYYWPVLCHQGTVVGFGNMADVQRVLSGVQAGPGSIWWTVKEEEEPWS